MSKYHVPVLVEEVLQFLEVKRGKRYIDTTLGGGGHTKRILELGGNVLGIDVDQDAVDFTREELKIGKNLTIARGNFKDIDTIARKNGFERVSGILFDLGVSSHQLETPARGFSFLNQGPLDMRMDKTLSVLASDLLQILTKGELYELFHRLGEDRNAWAIARIIVRARGVKKIETTSDLSKLIEQVSRKIPGKIHPATRVFQALRIVVNDELEALSEGLKNSIGILEENGVIVVISFHSLEDRIVKHFFKKLFEEGKGEILTKKPIVPTEEEVVQNPRSRSAILRAFRKT